MGIRMSLAETKSDAGAFSQDILKIEVTGPEQIHLTVIDVPGIFRVLVPGLTTETDIRMVEEMVKDYIRNPRTIILAVIPCNVDIATQEVLKLAKTADPQGTRTMAVLTKPDLATEQATQNAIMELVLEERNKLRLGYLVVKNRSADDHSSTTQARTASENAFFSADPWSRAAGRCGVHALTNRLRILLMNLSKKEIPAVKAEIVTRLRRNKNDLQAMGPSRADEYSQRQYLGEIAMNFQDITKAALSGEYSGRKLFKTEEELRLITRIMRLQKGFANIFRQRAHTDHFVEDYEAALHEPISEVEGEFTDQGLETEQGTSAEEKHKETTVFESPIPEYPDIQDIITDEDFICPIASNTPIIERVREVFDAYRGPDLGTFGGAILATVFEEQAVKWRPLTFSYVSRALGVVHHFIVRLLNHVCPEEQVQDQLWNCLLHKLQTAYRRAMDHAHFLLDVEFDWCPNTSNHYFNDLLQKKRADRRVKPLREKAITVSGKGGALPAGEYVRLEDVGQGTRNMDNDEQVCEDILDVFECYYKVAQKRFVDVVFQQVVRHYVNIKPLIHVDR
ncbi:Interferon-induced GTP-binding protein Mx1 [Purpureocillium lavendulum]|uniref:Interferon-induced GTP-binding protein Mx1 n=1 Tax=Purpureocillium lavendulum TaxID=1247861 RepID=A0AB34FG10_9HYPO|nr:Interferon-induced GTP-binding protein Mx1 [Purpureocillium lavendulum]